MKDPGLTSWTKGRGEGTTGPLLGTRGARYSAMCVNWGIAQAWSLLIFVPAAYFHKLRTMSSCYILILKFVFINLFRMCITAKLISIIAQVIQTVPRPPPLLISWFSFLEQRLLQFPLLNNFEKARCCNKQVPKTQLYCCFVHSVITSACKTKVFNIDK